MTGDFFVEMQGVEPWSRQSIHMLSTCLSSVQIVGIGLVQKPTLSLS